jgi:hypothetical protein
MTQLIGANNSYCTPEVILFREFRVVHFRNSYNEKTKHGLKALAAMPLS